MCSCWREVTLFYIKFLILSTFLPSHRKLLFPIIFLSLFWKPSIRLWASEVRQFRSCNSIL
uniref:AGP2 n=1 Tax=Arundo donax TaxID=35708 RepID=A0A0A9E5U4_ARUDO